MTKYPFCARSGEILYKRGCRVEEVDYCTYCYDYKLKPNGKVSLGIFYQNPNPKIIYMDFEYDMEDKALENICEDSERIAKLGPFYRTDYKKMNQIREDFKQACEDFFNNVIINSPDFSPAIRERVLEDNKRNEAERAKKEAESQKNVEEYRKQRAKEKAYEATHPKPKCPTCGSTNIKDISTLNRAVSVGMFGLASSKIGKTKECKDCGYKW